MRLAGILPSLPPEVYDEHECLELYRQLDVPLRRSLLDFIRSLVHTGASIPKRASPNPRGIIDRMAYDLVTNPDGLSEEDMQQVFDLMKKLRGDKGTPRNVADMGESGTS